MTILQIQRRLMESGRIRIGQQVPTKSGKTRPEKLETFRLTSRDERRINAAAQLYGGKPKPWEAPDGKQWEVTTERDWLDVIVPPAEMTFSQHYETWTRGGCTRRCDGVRDSISDQPCSCDPDDRECDIHTRLSVMLSELPGLGVWRLDTQGYYAAIELAAAIDIIRTAGGQGVLLPARLRLEQRKSQKIVKGKPETLRFAVPVLDVDVTPAQLLAGVQTFTLPAPVELPQLAAAPEELEAPRGNVTPIPARASRVREQMTAVETQERKSRTQPIPRTGVKPRTTAQAQTKPVADDRADTPERDDASEPQLKKLFALCRELGFDDDTRHRVAGVGSFNDLSKRQASDLIDKLEKLLDPGSPSEPPEEGRSQAEHLKDADLTQSAPPSGEPAPTLDPAAVVPMDAPDRAEFLSRLETHIADVDARKQYFARLIRDHAASSREWSKLTWGEFTAMCKQLTDDSWHRNRLARFRSSCAARNLNSNEVAASHGIVGDVAAADVATLQELIDLVEAGAIAGASA